MLHHSDAVKKTVRHIAHHVPSGLRENRPRCAGTASPGQAIVSKNEGERLFGRGRDFVPKINRQLTNNITLNERREARRSSRDRVFDLNFINYHDMNTGLAARVTVR